MNAAIAIAFLLLFIPVHGQTNTSCTGLMLRSFAPCTNFITGGSGGSPTADCCQSLKSLMSSGRDCLCLMFTGGVPLHVPINQTLAASLPRACNSDGVPIECKGKVQETGSSNGSKKMNFSLYFSSCFLSTIRNSFGLICRLAWCTYSSSRSHT